MTSKTNRNIQIRFIQTHTQAKNIYSTKKVIFGNKSNERKRRRKKRINEKQE